MRILAFWPKFPPFEPDRIGGLAVVVWELTREMKRQGVDLELATPVTTSAEQTEVEGIKVTSGALGKSLYWYLELPEEGRKDVLGYDGVLSFQGGGARPLTACADVKGKVVRHLHNVMSAIPFAYSRKLQPGLAERVRRYLAKREQESNEKLLRGVRTVCVSLHLVDEMLAAGLEARQNLHSIPKGVDTKSFRPANAEKEFDLLFVGNFYWVKGVDIVLEAVGALHAGGLDAKLGIAGKFDGNQRKHLLDSMPPTVRGSVSFLGVVDRARMPGLMNSAKLVVVPSKYETFGMVALEAIACGVPVVATSVGALPELVDSTVGRLASRPNAGDLAAVIGQYLMDEELAERCHANGPRRAQGYDRNSAASRLEVVFDSSPSYDV